MIGSVTATDPHRRDRRGVADGVRPASSPRSSRIVRDIGLAEELAQDALVAALEQWPAEGMPRNPGAWLMTAAKHRAIDRLRRRAMADRKHDQIAYETRQRDADAAGISRPRWTTTSATTCCGWCSSACHPVLSTEARVGADAAAAVAG